MKVQGCRPPRLPSGRSSRAGAGCTSRTRAAGRGCGWRRTGSCRRHERDADGVAPLGRGCVRCTGCQLGENPPVVSVTWVTPVPSAFIVKISVSCPLGADANAIFVPSGDHAGSTSAAAELVRFTAPVPWRRRPRSRPDPTRTASGWAEHARRAGESEFAAVRRPVHVGVAELVPRRAIRAAPRRRLRGRSPRHSSRVLIAVVDHPSDALISDPLPGR